MDQDIKELNNENKAEITEAKLAEEKSVSAKKNKKAEKETTPLQDVLETVAFAAVVFLIALLVKRFVGQPVLISGDSMTDTFTDHDLVWANKVGYTPQRFDVVIVESDRTNEKQYIKRIIALPGETIRIDDDDAIYITPADGGEEYKLEDPYGYFGSPKKSTANGYPKITYSVSLDGTYTCGDDEYFVIGDNRYNSTDSRIIGAFKRDEIVEHVVFRLWPLTKFGNFDKDNK